MVGTSSSVADIHWLDEMEVHHKDQSVLLSKIATFHEVRIVQKIQATSNS